MAKKQVLAGNEALIRLRGPLLIDEENGEIVALRAQGGHSLHIPRELMVGSLNSVPIDTEETPEAVVGRIGQRVYEFQSPTPAPQDSPPEPEALDEPERLPPDPTPDPGQDDRAMALLLEGQTKLQDMMAELVTRMQVGSSPPAASDPAPGPGSADPSGEPSGQG